MGDDYYTEDEYSDYEDEESMFDDEGNIREEAVEEMEDEEHDRLMSKADEALNILLGMVKEKPNESGGDEGAEETDPLGLEQLSDDRDMEVDVEEGEGTRADTLEVVVEGSETAAEWFQRKLDEHGIRSKEHTRSSEGSEEKDEGEQVAPKKKAQPYKTLGVKYKPNQIELVRNHTTDLGIPMRKWVWRAIQNQIAKDNEPVHYEEPKKKGWFKWGTK